MTISRSAVVGSLIVNCSFLLRIVFGPFHSSLVIIVSYIHYNILIFCVHFLTFKTLLASAFIVDFDRMSGATILSSSLFLSLGFTDKRVLTSLILLTMTFTMAGNIPKIINGFKHVPSLNVFLYLGATEEDFNSKSRGLMWICFAVLFYVLSLLAYMVIKTRSYKRY